VAAADLALVRVVDELHLEHLVRGIGWFAASAD
jgi:hypothetical protein